MAERAATQVMTSAIAAEDIDDFLVRFLIPHFLLGSAPGGRVLDDQAAGHFFQLLTQGEIESAWQLLGEHALHSSDHRVKAYIGLVGCGIALSTALSGDSEPAPVFEMAEELIGVAARIPLAEDADVWWACHAGLLALCLEAARVPPNQLSPFAPASDISGSNVLRFIGTYAKFAHDFVEDREHAALRPRQELMHVFAAGSDALYRAIEARVNRFGDIRRGLEAVMSSETRALLEEARGMSSGTHSQLQAQVVDSLTDGEWKFAAAVRAVERAYDQAYDRVSG